MIFSAPQICSRKNSVVASKLVRCPVAAFRKYTRPSHRGSKDALRSLGFIQGARLQTARSSIDSSPRQPQSLRIFFIQPKPLLSRLRVLQVEGGFGAAVVPRNLEQIPCVDRGIQVHQGCDALSSSPGFNMDRTRLPKLLEFHDASSGTSVSCSLAFTIGSADRAKRSAIVNRSRRLITPPM